MIDRASFGIEMFIHSLTLYGMTFSCTIRGAPLNEQYNIYLDYTLQRFAIFPNKNYSFEHSPPTAAAHFPNLAFTIFGMVFSPHNFAE